jgi:hypothetical protein
MRPHLRPIRLFDWVSEGGPGGAMTFAWLLTLGGESWVWPSGSPAAPAAALRAWEAPGRPGWERLHPIPLASGRYARMWRYCVEVPDQPWWDGPAS